MSKPIRTLALMCAVALAACSGASETPDPPPVEAPPAVEEPASTEPEPEPTPEPDPEPTPPPAETADEPEKKSWLTAYRGKPIIAKEAERATLMCQGADNSASVDANRLTCVQDLLSKAEDGQVIVVVDHPVGRGCETCVTMTAHPITPFHAGDHPAIVFESMEAGTVECTAGAKDQTLEQSREACYKTLSDQASRIRAGAVLPMAIEEGEPCKSCMAIAGTGYVVKVPAQ